MKKNEMRVLLDNAYSSLLHADHEDSLERALLVLTHAPKDAESYLLMAELAQENGRANQALAWIEQGLLHHPHHPGLLIKKASILIDEFEDIDEAYTLLKDMLIQLDKHKTSLARLDVSPLLLTDLYLLLIDCLRLKRQLVDALRYAQAAQKIAPFDENILLALATAYFELGDYDQAFNLITPTQNQNEPADFYRLKANILCAQGNFKEADKAFLESYKLNKSHYHKPTRVSKELFIVAFDQALLGLPREIRSLIEMCAIEIDDIVPKELVTNSSGTVSPQTCITIEKKSATKSIVIHLYQKNIENVALKKEDIKDVIASALIHELDKVAIESH